jgi:hypothetical protein
MINLKCTIKNAVNLASANIQLVNCVNIKIQNVLTMSSCTQIQYNETGDQGKRWEKRVCPSYTSELSKKNCLDVLNNWTRQQGVYFNQNILLVQV